jgi:gliding motility-associated-like protein
MNHGCHQIQKNLIYLFTCFITVFSGYHAGAQVVSFPGAVGFGSYATGGRGGTVYRVTTLADSGPGSFRDAVSAPGRIVVFDVGGYISLSSAVSVSSDITIAGQTAPGGGIGFKGGEISFANSHNIICRYIRIRPGSETASNNDDGLSFYDARNIIVDHVSIEFAPWNDIDGVSDDWQNKPVDSITVQNSIIADPTYQQFGAHTECVNGTWSWFNNIFANSHNRNPLAKINTVFINNVLYNYQAGYTTHTSTPFKHDIAGNYFIFGPATTSDNTWFQVDKNQSIYYNGNLKDSLADGTLNGGVTTPYWYQGPGTILTSPWSSVAAGATIYPAATAYRIVLSGSGALPRDAVDSLVISQIQTLGQGTVGTGKGTAGPDGGLYTSQAQTGLANNGYGAIAGGAAAADADGDGMPDFWEQATGSDANSDDAMDLEADGYSRIEHYLHWAAGLHGRITEDSSLDLDLQACTGGFVKGAPVYAASNAVHGTAVLQPDGHTVLFTPDNGFTGLASFEFTVTTSDAGTYSDTVVFAVCPPVAILAPSDVTLNAVSKDSATPYSVVTITWKDHSDNETGFLLQRLDPDTSGYRNVGRPAAGDTLFVDSTGLAPDKDYSYRLAAVNATDTSLFTAAVSVHTPALSAGGGGSTFDPSFRGLVGYWSFNETTGTTVTDSSSFQDNGALGPNTARISAKSGDGVDFANMEAVDYGVRIPDAPQLFLDKSSFSISFWMKADSAMFPSSNSTDYYLLCKGSIGTDPTIGSTGKRFDIECKDKQVRFAIDDANDANGGGKDELSTSATPLFTGKWVNVIAVRDTTDRKLRLYVNGIQVAEKSISKALSGIGEHAALIIGNIGEKELAAGKTTPAPYKGQLDELKIFNYVLSPSEIAALSGVVPKGLVGYWSFDEPGGTAMATDSSIYQDNGKLGAATVRVEGHKNNAVSFAGIADNGYGLLIPDEPQLYLDTSSFSISFWMKADPSAYPTSNSMDYYLLCKGSSGTDASIGSTGKRYALEFKNKKMYFAIDDANDANGGGKDQLSTDATPFFTGKWVHVVVIRNVTTLKLDVYLNGQLLGEGSIKKALTGIGEHTDLVLGNIGARELFSGASPAAYKGMLDELKIFNYPLSYAEILTLYTGGAYAQKPYSPSYNNTTVDGYGDTLKLTWKGGVNTNKYELYMGSDSLHMTLVDDSIDIHDPVYQMTDVPSQTTYYWRVDATGILGTTKGDVWSFTTGFHKALVGYWSFDEKDTATTLVDSSDYHDNGLLGAGSVRIPGHLNKGVDFENMDSAAFGAKIPDAPQLYLTQSSFTISFWMKADPAMFPSSNSTDYYVLCKGSIGTNDAIGSTGKRFDLEFKNKTLRFALDDANDANGGGKDELSTDATPFFTGKWVNVVVERDMDNKKMRIYVNDSLVKEGSIKKSLSGIGEHAALILGNIGEKELASGIVTPAPYRGKLDEVKIFNYALSDALLSKLYQNSPFLAKASEPSPADSTTGAGPEKVRFAWKEKSGTALSYNFYFGTSPDSLTLKGSHLVSPAFEVDSLPPSASYYWRVQDSSDAQELMGDVWTFATARDTTPPVVLTRNIAVQLNSDGNAAIQAAQLDSGSHDVYGIDTLLADIDSFSCANLGANKVLLTARDANGNVASDSAVVTVLGVKPDAPVITPADSTICYGDWIRLSPVKDTAAKKYQWYFQGQALANAATVNAYQAGRYQVVAVSAQSCRSDTSASAFLHFSSDTSLTVSPAVSIVKGAQTTLTASGSEGTLNWYPDIGINTTSGGTIVANPVSTTRYTATLTTTLGCQVKRSVVVTVTDGFKAQYNKLLTPNGDGINDKLVIKYLDAYPNNRIQIFDPAGKLIYDKNGYDNDWQGRLGSHVVPNGTYYFILTVNGEVKIRGAVTVIHH